MAKEKMKVPYFQVSNDIFDNEQLKLSIYEKIIYIFLCRCSNQGATAFPSYLTMAKRCGMSRSKAKTAVRGLRKKGLILVEWRPKENKDNLTNLYTVRDIPGAGGDRGGAGDDRAGAGGDPIKRTPEEELLKKKYREHSEECPTLSYYEFKEHNPVDKDTDNAITYYLDMYTATTGQDHLKLKPETWQGVVDTLLVVELEHGSDWIDCDDDNGSMYQMIDHYFSKDYNDGDCNRCITHFNHPGIKKVNFYESAY